MGNQNNGDWSNFAKFVPFNDSSHYHSYCLITDFNDQHQVYFNNADFVIIN